MQEIKDTEIPQPLVINGQEVKPGENTVIKINVGRLTSDTRIFVQLHVFRSIKPGPVILVLGGVHGDEINGIEIVRRSLEDGKYENLNRGSIIAIPLLNVYGFINFSRDVPDGKDVNRSFPGTMRGSLASRVARLITKKVLPVCDFIIDFHTGGSSRYNYPQVRYTSRDEESLHLAKVFNPPFIISKPVLVKSLRKVAKNRKMPMLVYESGEAQRLDGFSIAKGNRGLRRVLSYFDMIDTPLDPGTRSVHIKKTSWIRSSSSGIFTWTKSSGSKIYKGEPLGFIHDPYGLKKVVVLATREGYIIGHNNAPVVNHGDALFHIGYNVEEFEIE